jgi:hypothetical protein
MLILPDEHNLDYAIIISRMPNPKALPEVKVERRLTSGRVFS